MQQKNSIPYSSLDCIIAVGEIDRIEYNFQLFNSLKKYLNQINDWLFGFFSYDLKNETEDLSSENIDNIKMPDIHFFRPLLVFIINNDSLEIEYLEDYHSKKEIDILFDLISSQQIEKFTKNGHIEINSRLTKPEYIDIVNKFKKHIKRGDIYEANFCQEFFADNIKINPIYTFHELIKISPTPFSCFYKLDDKFLISASPERFLKKLGNKLISQPIKGTIKRGKDNDEDYSLVNKLKTDPKERAENVMIVDLVRNDLSRTAKKGTVKVEELCEIYSFPQVHQMISTVVSELNEDQDLVDSIKYAFPMGSMTGAPKIKAMQLIEKYEKTRRGLFSGSVGYFAPNHDFDFNVIIRSILYNETEKYLSFQVGGAITIKSDPENEYKECFLKAKAIMEVLKH